LQISFKVYYEVDGRDRCGFPEGKDCWTRIDTVANMLAAKFWKKELSAKNKNLAITAISGDFNTFPV